VIYRVLTSALGRGGWSAPCRGSFTPLRDIRCPFYRRLGGPLVRSGRVHKSVLPTGFKPRTDHPVSSQYTNYVILPHFNKIPVFIIEYMYLGVYRNTVTRYLALYSRAFYASSANSRLEIYCRHVIS